MNLFICVARIVTVPRLYRYKQKAITKMLICLPNYKKCSAFYYITAQAKSRLAHYIFDIYKKGNFVIIQGSLSIKSHKYSNNSKVNYNKKLMLKIHKIYAQAKNTK